MFNSLLACPTCKHNLVESTTENSVTCVICNKQFSTEPWLDLYVSQNAVNQATETIYKFYSKFSALIALLAYWIVWRGDRSKHISFFRNILRKKSVVVDLAIGDGTLTATALFSATSTWRAANVIALDISTDMLRKAQKKLQGKPVAFVRGDVCQLPFPDKSIMAISCFGGFNSFPSGEDALREMARCLAQNGILRGSLLLMPTGKWRQNLVRRWIRKGYQTEEIDLNKFISWVKKANMEVTVSEHYGDVLLFELRHLRHEASTSYRWERISWV